MSKIYLLKVTGYMPCFNGDNIFEGSSVGYPTKERLEKFLAIATDKSNPFHIDCCGNEDFMKGLTRKITIEDIEIIDVESIGILAMCETKGQKYGEY